MVFKTGKKQKGSMKQSFGKINNFVKLLTRLTIPPPKKKEREREDR